MSMAMMSEFPVQEYDTGDNSDVIATDSQKNTVYILAKLHGVASPEEFGLLVTEHFLSTYPWVTKSRVEVRLHPWQRILDRSDNRQSIVINATVCQMGERAQPRLRECAGDDQNRGGDP